MSKPRNRYSQVIEHIFFEHFEPGVEEFLFDREELEAAAHKLGVRLPKNLGDVIYAFRFRQALPDRILAEAPEGKSWVIELAGSGRYRFVAAILANIVPNRQLAETKILDATPGIIAKYALGDEQALLAKLRYNRLIDTFTGITCYSLQNHLRTQIPNIGQVETDELYIGLDRRGVHYVFPVQAKGGGTDNLSVVQIKQDLALCAEKFPSLICRPIASQFMVDDLIALFELESDGDEIKVVTEKHYRLVLPDALSSEELSVYRNRTS